MIDDIANRLTLDQLTRYYEAIHMQKLKELKLETIANLKATAYAQGSIKKDNFLDFLDSLDAKPRDIHKDFDKLKDKLPNVEDK